MNKLPYIALIASIGLSTFLFKQNLSLQQNLSIPIAYAQTAETIPSGTVVAFDLSACPSGWSEFTAARGRAIIGTNPTAGGGISVRTLGQTGGEEVHILTIAEMPSHNHPPLSSANFIINPFPADGGWATPGGGGGFVNMNGGGTTGNTGGGQAHNNMPPFIALLYCQKD